MIAIWIWESSPFYEAGCQPAADCRSAHKSEKLSCVGSERVMPGVTQVLSILRTTYGQLKEGKQGFSVP